MKKLVLMLMLVLGTASIALADPLFRVDQKDSYSPSDWITIQLYDSGQVDAFCVEGIIDVICPTGEYPAGGEAAELNEPRSRLRG